jgi:hypothetical protein
MGVQPPTDDLDEGPDVVEFGIAALDAELPEDGLSFPTDARSLRREYGDLTVPVDVGGTEMRLADALADCDRTEFRTRQDLLNALHPVFEAQREAVSNSLIAQLRSLVPF